MAFFPGLRATSDPSEISSAISTGALTATSRSMDGVSNVGNITIFGAVDLLNGNLFNKTKAEQIQEILSPLLGFGLGIFSDVEALLPESFSSVAGNTLSNLADIVSPDAAPKNLGDAIPKEGGGAHAQAVIQIATAEIGYKGRSNTEYQRWFGPIGGGYSWPWCAGFVSWVLNKAGFDSSDPINKDASTASWVKKFSDAGRYTLESADVSPQPGDLIFFNFDRSNDASRISAFGNPVDHTGIVIEALDDGRIRTVEGNTSGTGSGSQNNGKGVWEKTRARTSIHGWGRPNYSTGSVSLPGPDGVLGTADDIVVESTGGSTGGGAVGAITPGFQTWWADAIRSQGVTVEEVSGWKTAVPPSNTGGASINPSSYLPSVIVVHATATPSRSGEFPTRNTVINGNGDIPGPLYNIGVSRSGSRVYMFAANVTRNAGIGQHNGISGNENTIGLVFENDNSGEPLAPQAITTMAKVAAIICAYTGIPVSNVVSHDEWTTRKTDPNAIANFETFRDRVRDRLRTIASQAASGAPPTSTGGGGGSTGSSSQINFSSLNIGRNSDPWEGSQRVCEAIAFDADRQAFENVRIGSRKRANDTVAGDGRSDHWVQSTDSYAYDISVANTDTPQPNEDAYANMLADRIGMSRSGQFAGTQNKTITTSTGTSYRVQLIWRDDGHYDHIHMGVRRVST